MKLFTGLALALAGVVIASQWPDISRYLRIKQMSLGNGHPENVPTRGRSTYPSSSKG